MFKMTNIDSLGTVYTAKDQNGNVIKSVQVMTHTDILNAALGPFTNAFESIDSYLEKSIAVLEGFEEVDLYTTLWYATSEEKIVLKDLIEFAIQNGYDKIILEQLAPLTDNV